MSLSSDWSKAAEKFNTSVSLQYDQFNNNVIKAINGEYVQTDFSQLFVTLKKNIGSKTPIKIMVFELDIFNPPPPILLFINPETFDIKWEAKSSENRVRQTDSNDSGYIVQFHHDELDVISASGHSAMFYTDAGITAYDRVNSPAYNNIQQLVAYYRNNGKNLSRKPGKYSLIESVGRVILTYDDTVYKGSFESFSVTETEEKPFNLEFSFDYKITKEIDTNGKSSDILQNVQA